MAKYEIVKKIKEKKSETTMVNLTNLLFEILDCDNSKKKKVQKKNEAKDLITKC